METQEGWAVSSPFGFASRAALRLIGGSEQALGRRRRPPPVASIRLVQRLDAFGDRLRSFAQPVEFACFIWVPAIASAFAAWEELHGRLALQDFGIFRTAALDGDPRTLAVRGHPNPSRVSRISTSSSIRRSPPCSSLRSRPCRPGPSRALMFAAGLVAHPCRAAPSPCSGLALLRGCAHLCALDQLGRPRRAHLVPAPRRGPLPGATATTPPWPGWRLP